MIITTDYSNDLIESDSELESYQVYKYIYTFNLILSPSQIFFI